MLCACGWGSPCECRRAIPQRCSAEPSLKGAREHFVARESRAQRNLENGFPGADESGGSPLEAQSLDELSGRLAKHPAKVALQVKPRLAGMPRDAGQRRLAVKTALQVSQQTEEFLIAHRVGES
jgi:hypothetical protein